MNDLREYLQTMADSWGVLGHPAVMERFVLRNGTEFEGRDLPKGFRRGKAKACFENSINLVVRKRDLRYVEGYVMHNVIPIPIHHAWAVDADNRVIDVTIQQPAECQYMGVVMSRQECWTEVSRNDVYGVLDTGLGANVRFMFERDPELKAEVETIASKRWRVE